MWEEEKKSKPKGMRNGMELDVDAEGESDEELRVRDVRLSERSGSPAAIGNE